MDPLAEVIPGISSASTTANPLKMNSRLSKSIFESNREANVLVEMPVNVAKEE